MKISFQPNKTGYLLIAIMILTLGIIAIKKRSKIKNLAMDTLNYLKEKTWDWRSDTKIKSLHPKIRAKTKEFIIRAEKELGIKLRISSGYRSWSEQNTLYAKGRTTPGKIITNAKAGDSYHNYGLAIDVIEIKDGQALWENPRWEEIAALGTGLGFQWGGNWGSFKDKPHFQYTFGKSIASLKALYKSGNKTEQYVNLV